LLTEKFTYHSIKDWPTGLAEHYSIAKRKAIFAEPGKEWQRGCIADGRPPNRLIFSMASTNHWVVAYQVHFATGVTPKFDVFSLDEANRLKLVWYGEILSKNEVKTIEGFKKMLKRHDFISPVKEPI
jgi:hypothetical protein